MKSDSRIDKTAHGMRAAVKRFVDDRRGAFAMQFALMVVPLMICTGLAIDGGRAFLAKYELGQALDAAALAVGSTTLTEQTAMEDMARKYTDLNFKTEHDGEINVEVSREDGVVTVTGDVTIDTFFMPLIGRPTVLVSAASQVQRGGGNVEVVLALDVTASMTMYEDRMTPLKAAASSLVNTVVNDDQDPYYSRVAVVPWASAVHVGAMANTLRGTPVAATSITGAGWSSIPASDISGAQWRTGSSVEISDASWKNGGAVAISRITKITSGAANKRIKVITTNNHGYADGQFVLLSGANGGMTFVNNVIYMVADSTANTKEFYLKNTGGTYITSNSTLADSTATTASSQRCYNATCRVQVTTATNHGFATGNRIYITGVTGITQVNNVQTTNPSWAITKITNTTFTLDNLGYDSTPAPGTWSSSGASSSKTATRCLHTSCNVQITTAAAHGLTSDTVFSVFNVQGFTYVNTGTTGSWKVGTVVDTTKFIIKDPNTNQEVWGPGVGGSDYTAASNDRLGRCAYANCKVQVTSTAHGIAGGERVKIAGVGGMTGLNVTTPWVVSGVTTNTMLIDGTFGPDFAAYTSGGTAACIKDGCATRIYQNTSGTWVSKAITECVSERVGSDVTTDAAPTTTLLGNVYPAGGYNVCGTANRITPLTNSKKALTDHINSMTVTGSTAGQVGTAWGWYMLSPAWDTIWSGFSTTADDYLATLNNPATNQPYGVPTYYAPSSYTAPKTSKVMVLMTDGDFNMAYCTGLASTNYNVSTTDIPQNCNATNGAPFDQAQALCTAIKAQHITIYTIGFDTSPSGPVATFLQTCATQPWSSHYYLVTDSASITAAFAEIAQAISKLRVTQ